MIGVVVVLPASRRERLGVLAGTVLCLGGVWLFTQSYPHSWTDGANQMAFPTMLTYFAGGSLAFWFVFTAIAEFHVRNNPTDEVSLELKRQGEDEDRPVVPAGSTSTTGRPSAATAATPGRSSGNWSRGSRTDRLVVTELVETACRR